MKSLEKLITNDELFFSGFFTEDLFDERLKEVNEYILRNFDNKKDYLKFKAYLNHWSRSIECQYIYLNIAKYIIDYKKNYQDKNFKLFNNASGGPATAYFLANHYGMNVQGSDLLDLSREWEESDTSSNGSLSFKVADSLNLPFQNEIFDISFCISAIEQIHSPIKAIEEMIRVTKSGGLILFTMDITHYNNNLSDWYVNNENFKTIQSRLKDSCYFFAPPTFSVPSNILNWEKNVDKRNLLRRFLSNKYRKLINKEVPNFYIFGSSWIKK